MAWTTPTKDDIQRIWSASTVFPGTIRTSGQLARSSALARRRQQASLKIVAVEVTDRKGVVQFARDETSRPDTTIDTLAKLKPAFRKGGMITAGNAPGLNSAAAAMIVAQRQFAERQGLEPITRLVSQGVAAVEPGMFGLGPIPAVQFALERAGWSHADTERIEINEAFVAITLACLREMGLPEDIVNVEGGAIAHGHAISSTGVVL